MFYRFILQSFLFVCISVLAGCGYFKVKVDTSEVTNLHYKYTNNNLVSEPTNQYIKQFSYWYKAFNNRELDFLIISALTHNLTLHQAYLNLKAANCQLGTQKKNLIPNLTVQAEYENQRYSKTAAKKIHATRNDNNLVIGLTASYELDIWGKNYSFYQQNQNKSAAQQETFNKAKITIVANMMNLWVNLMAIREAEQVASSKLADADALLKLQHLAYTTGNADISDLFQQESQILQLENTLTTLKSNEQATLRSINILIGREPLAKLDIKSKVMPKLEKLPSSDINVMVLAQRPDIKEAYYTMVANKWGAKAANLSRLPSFTISPSINFNGDHLNTIVDYWLFKTVLSGVMPLFEAGALKAQAQAQKYLSDASVINYKQVLYNAINELKGALDSEVEYKTAFHNTKKQVILLQQVQDQVQQKYLNGDASYTDILSANNQVNQAKSSLIDLQKQMLLNRVLFYRALGISILHHQDNN